MVNILFHALTSLDWYVDLASRGWLKAAKRRYYVAGLIVTSFSWWTFICSKNTFSWWTFICSKNNNTCLMGDAILRIPRDARVRAYRTRDTYDGVVPATSKRQPYCLSSYMELSGFMWLAAALAAVMAHSVPTGQVVPTSGQVVETTCECSGVSTTDFYHSTIITKFSTNRNATNNDRQTKQKKSGHTLNIFANILRILYEYSIQFNCFIPDSTV